MATLNTAVFEIATPMGLALHTDATEVTVPSVQGQFGMLAGHLPLLAATKPGVVEYKNAGKSERVAVGAGFVEVGPNKVLLLCDLYTTAKDVDKAAVKAELEQTEKAIAAFGERLEGAKYEELARRLEWCQAQLEVAKGA